MPMSIDRATQTLDDTLRGSATPHLWLHTDDPTSAGTASVMKQNDGTTDAVRKPITMDVPEQHPTNNEVRSLSTAVVEWSGAEAQQGQFITHASIWSAATGGQPEHIVAIGQTPAPGVGEDGIRVPIGDLEVALVVYVT